jgi:adenine phosphoribosyltransferase
VPDFPRPGIGFQDLCPVLARPRLLAGIADAVAARFAGSCDALLAVEARGFVYGAAIARAAELPLVLARKAGKLPGPVDGVEYALEYGRGRLEIQHEAFTPGARILLVDDVLATGGTLQAAATIVHNGHGVVAGCAVVMTISGLGGPDRLAPAEIFSVVTVDD